MLIVGIDPSLTGTAIAVVDQYGTIVDTQRFRSSPRSLDGDRVDLLVHEVCEYLCKRLQNEEIRIFIEGYAFSSNHGKAFTRAEYIGLLKHILRISNMFYWTVPPTSLKKHTVAGLPKSTKTKKGPMLDAVAQKYNYETDDDNLADAVALAMYGYAIVYQDCVYLPHTCESIRMSD